MIIFLYGQDTYRARQKLKEIVVHYQKVHRSGLNLKFLNLSPKISEKLGGMKKDLDFSDFEDIFGQSSMLDEKKLIVLENVFSNQKFKEEFLKQKDKIKKTKDIVVIFEQDKVKENDRLFKFLKTNHNAKYQEFKLLEKGQLKNWARKEFIKEKAEIAPRALDKMTDFVGNDLWRFSNEIKKLANFKKGKVIEEKDVELLIKPKIEAEVFKTIEVVAKKNKKKALTLIEKHLAKGDSPLYLLSMLNYQFRNLLIAKAVRPGDSEPSGIHPYALKKAKEAARLFSLEELKKIYQKIFKTDLDIKTGKIAPEEGIKMLVLGI